MSEGKVAVSYQEAPRVAIQMMDGIEPTTLYDKIQGKNILNYKGVSLLANIMDVEIFSVNIVESETDENVLVVCAEAKNPADHRGFSYIGKPKKVMKDGKLVPDESYRSKAFTNAKRNALKDLVPHQVFCEMLVRIKQTSQAQPQAQPAQERPTTQQTRESNGGKKTQEPIVSKELKEVRDKARQVGIDSLNGILGVLGLDVQDCMNEVAAQTGISDTDEWNVAHWEQLIQILERPVGMGMTKAVEAWNKLNPDQEASKSEEVESPEQNAKDVLDAKEDTEDAEEEDIFSDADESDDAEEDLEVDDEKTEEQQLSMFIEDLNKESKSE